LKGRTVPQESSTTVDIVLVHGLFIGSWAWEPVQKLLHDEFAVYAPELPFQTLKGDAAVVREQVSASVADGHSVLLMGHSYGGMVVSEAGHEATELAFIAALAPDPGQTTAQIAEGCVSDICNEAMVPAADGESLSLAGPTAVDAWYHLCSPERTAFGMAHHRSAPTSIFNEPVEDPAWLHKPSSYIVCGKDRSVALDYQRSRGALMKRTETVVADHSPFFSATEDLANVIASIARSMSH
jgi:pimeloyl-ACP methyl ester carboxylesterase